MLSRNRYGIEGVASDNVMNNANAGMRRRMGVGMIVIAVTVTLVAAGVAGVSLSASASDEQPSPHPVSDFDAVQGVIAGGSDEVAMAVPVNTDNAAERVSESRNGAPMIRDSLSQRNGGAYTANDAIAYLSILRSSAVGIADELEESYGERLSDEDIGIAHVLERLMTSARSAEEFHELEGRFDRLKEKVTASDADDSESQSQCAASSAISTGAVVDDDERDGLSVGDAIAKLAVNMAATASPEERIPGVEADPWFDNGDPRIDNLVRVMDATLGAWDGNNAYASCCQASCGVIAAAADPDIAPAHWVGDGNTDDPWEPGMGGSGCPTATLWYAKSRPDLYMKVGESLPISELEPGDLLASEAHVMIYVGEDAARERFPGTDANFYQASFNSGGPCLYAGLSRIDNIDGFTVFRLRGYNVSAAHVTIDWKSMLDIA